jgi:DNA-binding transcriptional MerR regulator
MPLVIDGMELYRIGEALHEAGLSRATYFRWVKQGKVLDTRFKDRNGRRVFTSEELEELKRISQRLIASPVQMEMQLKVE